MKRIAIGILIFLLYSASVFAVGSALHFSGTRFILFCSVLGVLGIAAIAFAVWYLSKVSRETQPGPDGGADSTNLDTLIRDANRKLRSSRTSIKSISSAQIIYILGEDNSAKTQTVLESGLDAELLAGDLFRDGVIAPTQLANIWLAGPLIIVEAGGALLRQPALWKHLMSATLPGKLRFLFSKRAKQPARAVVLCVNTERLPGPTESGYNAEAIRAAAQSLNQRLRELSQTLGISLPVYVLFTKLDTVGQFAGLQHFADYTDRLSQDEVKPPLGSLLAPVEVGSGRYAERAAGLVGTRLDELIYAMSEFRLDVLSRGGELKALASAYEFPRDLWKRRSTFIDFLVELTRPSQLSINPFLRGFFFSGKRVVIVDEAVAAAVRPERIAPVDQSATVVFSVAGGQLNRPHPTPQRAGSRKVPQWVFLSHFFSHLLLNDKSAFEASQSSRKVINLKRTLLACVIFCFIVCLALLTISFFNNRELEQNVSEAAAIPVYRPEPGHLASKHDLQSLDQLATLLLRLDAYRKDGPPLMDRWGLYIGDALYPRACYAYSVKFRALLLSPAQSNILSKLRGLQVPRPAGADYTATYKPLKAYLISTSNPEKSAANPGFLAPVLTSEWAGPDPLPSDLATLAQTEFQTYATLLAQPASCLASTGGPPDITTRDHAREYLNGFGGFQHVYQSMLVNADKQFPSVHFEDKSPAAARSIIDPYNVPGAFTKDGFVFMQNAIQHPDAYYSGEEWVLGKADSPMPDRETLVAQLQKQYITEYVKQWRNYLTAAKFIPFKNWNDAAIKLDALDSPSSPTLQLFALLSINTGVAQPEIAHAFQAPQYVVPANTPPGQSIANVNRPYIDALKDLEQAVKALNANSLSTNDPAAAIPVEQAALAAEKKAKTLRDGFNADPEGGMDSLSFIRLEDPITNALTLAKGAPAAGANGSGKAFCSQAQGVLGKFPFNRKASVEATPDEVAAFFSPVQGTLAQFESKQSQLITFQAGQWVANPATAVPVNPGFLHFLNSAQRVSAALFPEGGNRPTLSLTLKEGKTVPDGVLTIDSQQVTAGQSITVRWASSPDSKIIYNSGQKPHTLADGPWSIFHFGLGYNHPSSNSVLPTVPDNGRLVETVPFEVEGAGAFLLDPHFMDQLRCVSTVAKP